VCITYDGRRGKFPKSPNPGFYVIAQCSDEECSGFVFGEVDNLYPKSAFPLEKKAFPEPILNDYNEALKCFEVGAFKAAAVICRRVLQYSVEDKGGEGKDLLEKINDLDHKGVITKDIRTWAHQIRMFGKYGAHPFEEKLDFVDDKEAEVCLEFLKNYLHYVYEMPRQVIETQRKFDKVKQKKA